MINPNYDIGILENALYEAFFNMKVSKNVFPKEVLSKMEDYVIARFIGEISDEWATGKGLVAIELYAKDLHGYKNSPKLTEMQASTVSTLSHLSDNYNKYTFQAISTYDKNSNALGFSCRVINLRITINN